ncbi:MAG: NAD-glutamate dehydrogenase, partial [Acetobacteraceae bacterium]
MLRNEECLKLAHIEEAALLAESGAAGGDAAPAGSFVRVFYHAAPPAEILRREPTALAEAALSMWRYAAQRTPGRPAIRMLAAEGGRGLVQIITDDMPFLVDSVSAALTRLGFEIDLVIHPVLGVTRDAAGRLTECAAGLADGRKESMMQFELIGDVGPERQATVVARLEAVLADVRAVVGAWPSMRGLVQRMAQAIEAVPPPAAAGAAEDAAFLRWLDDGNFLFLGYREYVLRGSELAVVAGAGKGLLQNDDVLVFDGLRALTRRRRTCRPSCARRRSR